MNCRKLLFSIMRTKQISGTAGSVRINRSVSERKKVIHCIGYVRFPEREAVIVSFRHYVVDGIAELTEDPDIVLNTFPDEFVAAAHYVQIGKFFSFRDALFYCIVQIVRSGILIFWLAESRAVKTVPEVS